MDILGVRERATEERWRKRDGEAVVVAGKGREGERGERFVVPLLRFSTTSAPELSGTSFSSIVYVFSVSSSAFKVRVR